MENLNPKKILVVEDEPSILKAVVEVLGMHGYQVFSATDGEHGLALASEVKPDLVLLDLILPGKNGFEVLKELKSTVGLSDIPVIISSNLGDEEEVQQGLKLGAADYLIKADYDLDEVVKIVAKNLKPA
ncbi:MAG: response regulator [Patescibacteria group bacterium]|nr:response regulator [Patescibacteria group bacterium]